jgi:hypothetical protein
MTVMLAPEQLIELADLVAARIRPAMPTPMLLPLTTAQFAEQIGRKVEYVQDWARIGGIRHLPGKPYRFLPEEVLRYKREGLLIGRAAKRRAAS